MLFVPKRQNEIATQTLELLGKMATTSAIFEPFRNPVTANKIGSCVGKLLDYNTDRGRQDKRAIAEQSRSDDRYHL